MQFRSGGRLIDERARRAYDPRRSRRCMIEIDPKHVDPRLIERASQDPRGAGVPLLPGRGPISMPMAAPGPQGGMNRYREMTLEEMLLENRVIFLVGEINHISAARTYTQMLYLQ